MQSISTHIFDAALGVAATGIPVRLERHADGQWHAAGIAITDDAGNARPLQPGGDAQPLIRGDYRLTFEVAAYFKMHETTSPYPFVQVTFTVDEIRHYHVPLLLSGSGYSTYLSRP